MTLPIDCDRNKHSVKVKTISLDLAKPQSWETLRYIIRNCNVAAVHIAPPCGTCSRAREKRLNSQQHGPRPLGNERFPYGIPNLRPHEEVRVKAANALYINMAEFCLWLLQKKVTFTIENPTNSWLWRLPCMKELVELCYMSNFHNCAYGGLRFKCTSMLTNDERFLQLDREPRGSSTLALGSGQFWRFCYCIRIGVSQGPLQAVCIGTSTNFSTSEETTA